MTFWQNVIIIGLGGAAGFGWRTVIRPRPGTAFSRSLSVGFARAGLWIVFLLPMVAILALCLFLSPRMVFSRGRDFLLLFVAVAAGWQCQRLLSKGRKALR